MSATRKLKFYHPQSSACIAQHVTRGVHAPTRDSQLSRRQATFKKAGAFSGRRLPVLRAKLRPPRAAFELGLTGTGSGCRRMRHVDNARQPERARKREAPGGWLPDAAGWVPVSLLSRLGASGWRRFNLFKAPGWPRPPPAVTVALGLKLGVLHRVTVARPGADSDSEFDSARGSDTPRRDRDSGSDSPGTSESTWAHGDSERALAFRRSPVGQTQGLLMLTGSGFMHPSLSLSLV